MAEDYVNGLTLLPDEMLKFVLDSSHRALQAPRLGQLLTRGRAPVQTPHFVAATSRGVVPHLAHDVLRKHTDISAVYMGLEDCESLTPVPAQPLTMLEQLILMLGSHRKVVPQCTYPEDTNKARRICFAQIYSPAKPMPLRTWASTNTSSHNLNTKHGLECLDLHLSWLSYAGTIRIC